MPVFFDFETLIARRGRPRTFTRFFEIGAVCLRNPRVLSMLVDPVAEWEITDAKSLVMAVFDSGMNPRPSIRFWAKTLKRKGHPYFLKRYRHHFRRRTELGPLPYLESASDMAYAHSLTDMIREGRNRESEFDIDVFTLRHPLEALIELRELIYSEGDNTLVAHNGRSFDFHVLKGNACRYTHSRTELRFENVNMVDSIPIFRKLIPGYKTYSQPLLYSSLFGEQYDAHIAIDDARALRKIWVRATTKSKFSSPRRPPPPPPSSPVSPSRKPPSPPFLSRRPLTPLELPPPVTRSPRLRTRSLLHERPIIVLQHSPETKKSRVTQIPGIGPSSARSLAQHKIFKISELHAFWLARKKEGKTLKGVVRFWRKVETFLENWS